MSDTPRPVGRRPDLHADEKASFLRTMGLEYRLDEGTAWGRAALTDYLMAGPGWPSVSVLLTYADVLIGVSASTRTAPRISITSSLSVHLAGPVASGTEIEMRCHITRAGRTVTVGETTVYGSGGAVAAAAVGTFQASPRPQDVVPDAFGRLDGSGHVVSDHPTLADHVGLEVVRPGLARIALRPDLVNGTESLQGGLVALLGEVAAQSAAAAAMGPTGGSGDARTGPLAVVDSLEVHYLAAARVGPFLAQADAVGPHLWRVVITDPGMDDRVASLIVARTRPVAQPVMADTPPST